MTAPTLHLVPPIPDRPAHLIRVAVPRLNKCSHVSEYLKQMEVRDYDLNWAAVTDNVTLSPADWNEFMGNLLECRPWLEGKGGAGNWNPEYADLTPVQACNVPRTAWLRTMYLEVVAVRCGGAVVYIDPEGYGYARYVAFACGPEGRTRGELRAEAVAADKAAKKATLDARLTDPTAKIKSITRQECAAMIKAALKAGFPKTTFSVRGKAYSGGHSIYVTWTDGPTTAQVSPIIDRYESKGFDGMTDSSYCCGTRVLCGCLVEVNGGYVHANRRTSMGLRNLIIKALAKECGIEVTPDEHGNVSGSLRVGYQWHPHYNEGRAVTLEALEGGQLLAHSTEGEWFSNLVNRIEGALSLEEGRAVPAELLPEYVEMERS